jgi:hypothetical protein
MMLESIQMNMVSRLKLGVSVFIVETTWGFKTLDMSVVHVSS